MSKKILLLSSIYPADDIPKTFTPVVHYFTREWVKQGNEVVVINYKSTFPRVLYIILKLFKNIISSKVGYEVMTSAVPERNYMLDGVKVYRLCLRKIIPHGRYSAKELEKAFYKTATYCKYNDFYPDVIISHWSNPQLALMCRLKEMFKVPTCYIAHDPNHFTEYGYDARQIWESVDLIGYRSDAIKRRFETSHKYIKPSFMCYSGIPAHYNDNTKERFYDEVKNIAYVGTLVERKHPALILHALVNAIGHDFLLKYAGEGHEAERIKLTAQQLNVSERVCMLGRINRDEVIKLLDESDLFIMISERETYGLVYLEAMARGCITIASRNEGFDGIIQDGVNGFLCEAGNVNELSKIIAQIASMSVEERKAISLNAMHTAKLLTDENVASYYLEQLFHEK